MCNAWFASGSDSSEIRKNINKKRYCIYFSVGVGDMRSNSYHCIWRLWPQCSVPLFTAVNKAALRCAYEHRDKRKKMPSKVF